ncbi:protein AF-9-like [Physella acuta]|uniref:protein AF-9-like n=1 Tax=Physella acuta TaxID=109671 RepID=UPI0027DC1FBD|nr:protein AF-9-like [Physella acuta]
MAPKETSDCVVTVTIELGHQANYLKEPSPEGFTHDWTVFVRGFEGSRIEAFVERVVFRLHKTFKLPLRTICEPPFKVTESGYAGFLLPIEIHFKNKQSPRKIVFSYDLFLNAKDSPPINNVRYEKLKFQNPTPEFKAKLLKAGGVEQGSESAAYSVPVPLAQYVKVDHKRSIKPPKDKEKKKKKKSSLLKSASPSHSLSSLSSLSPDDDEEEEDHYNPPPPPPPKKEKDPSHKKESSASSMSRHDFVKSPLSTSSHKDKSKHRSSSSLKEKPSTDSESVRKPHKHRSKDKEGGKSSHKEKDGSKKERDLSSSRPKESSESRKDREGSHSSTKSSASSSLSDKKNYLLQMSGKDKEQSSHSKERDRDSSSHKEKHSSSGKEKERSSSHKQKHTSHKDISNVASSEPKKTGESSKTKVPKENNVLDKKSQKRHQESPQVDITENKKLKRSLSVASNEEKPPKPKSESKKEKGSASKESRDKESHKDKKDTESKSSSSKSKHEKSKHSDKHKQSQSSESKNRESSEKDSSSKQTKSRSEKPTKSDSMTKSERLAMTADFQPKLLLSPLQNRSSDDESHEPATHPEQKKMKVSKSSSSISSLSSSHEMDKSDDEMVEDQEEKAKDIVSGLTDSDSESDEDTPTLKSQQKMLKTLSTKSTSLVPDNSKPLPSKSVAAVVAHEKSKKGEPESVREDGHKRHHKHSKQHRSGKKEEDKKYKEKLNEPKNGQMETHDIDEKPEGKKDDQSLDILAPNGIPIGELISINEKIEKAQTESNQDLIDKVVEIIGNTDEFDIDETALKFDICSVEKAVVLQIQLVLRGY